MNDRTREKDQQVAGKEVKMRGNLSRRGKQKKKKKKIKEIRGKERDEGSEL